MSRVFLNLTLLLPAVLAAQTPPAVPAAYYRTFYHKNPVFKHIRAGERFPRKPSMPAGATCAAKCVIPKAGNPLTGPFFIEGAEPGDAIRVQLRKVRLNRNWGYSNYRLLLDALQPAAVEGMYANRFKPDSVIPGRANAVRWDLDPQRNTVKLHEPASARVKFEFPAVPMLGCIGVAAPGDFAPTSGPAGSYGGNMDYNEVREGATVILPVYHRGALLFIGDGHALMADGEPSGTGIETSMDVEFSVELRKKANLRGPRLENTEYIISVGAQPEFASSLDRALQMATTDMASWLEQEYKIEPWAAHQLIAMQGKYDVVTVAGTMALKIARKWLP